MGEEVTLDCEIGVDGAEGFLAIAADWEEVRIASAVVAEGAEGKVKCLFPFGVSDIKLFIPCAKLLKTSDAILFLFCNE